MGFPFPIPYDPNQPIPNNPFYYPETNYIYSALGPLVVGAGLNINYSTSTLTSTGGGGVTDINAGFGIHVSQTTGSVLITNVGVRSLIAGPNITLSSATGDITISATGGGGGGVTAVTASAPLASSGGATPNITLANTAVTPGPYTYASFTVDAQGRLTAASNGVTPVIVNDFNAKGDLLVGTGASAFTALAVGADGEILTADSTCAEGVKWAAGPVSATPTVEGILFGCSFGWSTSVGENALLGNTGDCNTAVGGDSLCNANAGRENTAVGHYALRNNQTGDSNTAVGQKALIFNDGSNNVAVGVNALYSNSTGGCNTAVGLNALYYGDTGCENTGVGWRAGTAMDTGCYNTALGSCTLENISGCSGNTALGSHSLLNITGSFNTAIGYCSGDAQISGDCNVFIGCGVTAANPNGSCQLAIGFSATNNWLTGDNTKAIQPGGGIIDCAGSCGAANQVLVSTGANALEWKSVNSTIATPYYGSFTSVSTQTVGVVNTGQAVRLSGSGPGFFINNLSEITAINAGTYNIQISLQILSQGGGGGDVEVWFVKNFSPISNSNTRYSVKNANEEEVAALNIIETFAASDNIQVYWASDNPLMVLAALPSTMGGPVIPSAIVTVVPVGA